MGQYDCFLSKWIGRSANCGREIPFSLLYCIIPPLGAHRCCGVHLWLKDVGLSKNSVKPPDGGKIDTLLVRSIFLGGGECRKLDVTSIQLVFAANQGAGGPAQWKMKKTRQTSESRAKFLLFLLRRSRFFLPSSFLHR